MYFFEMTRKQLYLRFCGIPTPHFSNAVLYRILSCCNILLQWIVTLLKEFQLNFTKLHEYRYLFSFQLDQEKFRFTPSLD